MFTLAPEASTGTALGGRTIHMPWAFAARVAFQAVNSARGLANLPALEGHSCG